MLYLCIHIAGDKSVSEKKDLLQFGDQHSRLGQKSCMCTVLYRMVIDHVLLSVVQC